MKTLTKFFVAALICCFSFIDLAYAQGQKYVLSLSLMIPPVHNRWNYAIKPWIEELNRRSGGRIIVEPYFAEALSKAADSYQSVSLGIADLAEFVYDMSPGQFPFHERSMTLVSPDRSLENPAMLLAEMEKAFPEVMEEVKDVKVLFSHIVNVGMLVGTKEPITSLEDFKNRKINVDGDAQASQKLSALGASVVYIPTSDVFMSLQQGVVDGTTCDFDLLVSRRFGDVIKHMTLVNTAAASFAMVMNKDVYNSLPKDLQKIFDEVSAEYGTKKFNDFWASSQYRSLHTWMEKMGGKVHMLTDNEYKIARDKTESVGDEWVKVVNQAGLPGEKLRAKFMELQEIYTKPWAESQLAQELKK